VRAGLCPRAEDERSAMPPLVLALDRALGWEWLDSFMVSNVILSKLWGFIPPQDLISKNVFSFVCFFVY